MMPPKGKSTKRCKGQGKKGFRKVNIFFFFFWGGGGGEWRWGMMKLGYFWESFLNIVGGLFLRSRFRFGNFFGVAFNCFWSMSGTFIFFGGVNSRCFA